MTPRTAAILATRLIGLVILLISAASIASQFIPVLQFMGWIEWTPRLIWRNLSGGSQFGLSLAGILLAATGLLIGHYLLFRGQRVHRWLLAGLDASTCSACGYSLRGITATRCPECGTRIECSSKG